VTSASVGAESRSVAWTQPAVPALLDFAWPAGVGTLAVDHKGTGNPWVTVQSRAAVPLTEPLSSGYRIEKTIESVQARVAGRYSVGDILRVRLRVEAQADMTWVVVNDPIPAGASHLGTGLARDSQIATTGEKRDEWNQPAYVERAFDGYRAYYEFVPKGTLVTEYTIRLNQSGDLLLPTTRVEALYAPETFGEIPNPEMVIEP
jgi:alpha-2-macroglobulin